MRKHFMQVIGLFLLIVNISSCSKKDIKEAKYIPKDASFVFVSDAASLSKKLEDGGISIDSIIKKAVNNDSDYQKVNKEFQELKECGISWRDKFYIFSDEKLVANKGTLRFVSTVINISDSVKLLKYLQKNDQVKGRDVKKEKNFSYIQFDYKGIIAWNDKVAIATLLFFTENNATPFNLNAPPVKTQSAEGLNKTEELQKQATKYFTQKENESIASVKIFTDMFTEKADAYSFSSTNSVVNLLNGMSFRIDRLEELVQNNYATSTFNFAEGKIVGKTKTYTNATVSALLKKYAGPTVNTSLIENYPSQNIAGFSVFAFNPDIFNGILKELEVESLANGFLEKVGFSTNDIFKCLKGDIAVIVSDINIQPNETKKPFAKLIFNAPIADKNSLHKILDKAVEAKLLYKNGGTYNASQLASGLGLFIKIDDKNIILASDSATYTAYINSTIKANIAPDVLSAIKGKSTAANIDLQKIFTAFETSDSNSTSKKSLAAIKATFKDIIATSDNFNGKSIDGNFEIRLNNEKENSLVTLLKLIPNVVQPLKKQETVDDIKSLSFLKLLYAPSAIPMY
jgi:hypothetical protein